MAVDYSENIKFINDENPIEEYHYLKIPDTCPICSFGISPRCILVHEKSEVITELLFGCPRYECNSLFFAIYRDNVTGGENVSLYPNSKENRKFPEEITEVSSEFVLIYNQAHHAEQEGLNLICGVGYRKALEYLIKDFAIVNNPDNIEKIQRIPLQQCVQKYINQSDIRGIAERAVWLGNDETHYVRKWDNKDIKDLKNLIDLTVFYLSMELKGKKYLREMSQKSTKLEGGKDA
ncbi:DUF4145 domain-containing protein [Bacillus megaterium]|uniref:DUF4145 domain-containing protein n=1 Tax=Priestia megaterium TaxID=1404 RepID=UPI001293D12F|nr:DUF4145 domain-containing protein [Priestia megaterium]MQR89334.1 DUF4145 domain-containing protein [Priestia megaterium]